MARLKITIEGEMSPEEMKRYIAAAWGNLPRDIAVSEVDLDEPSGTVGVPVLAIEETVAVPVVADPIQELPAWFLCRHTVELQKALPGSAGHCGQRAGFRSGRSGYSLPAVAGTCSHP